MMKNFVWRKKRPLANFCYKLCFTPLHTWQTNAVSVIVYIAGNSPQIWFILSYFERKTQFFGWIFLLQNFSNLSNTLLKVYFSWGRNVNISSFPDNLKYIKYPKRSWGIPNKAYSALCTVHYTEGKEQEEGKGNRSCRNFFVNWVRWQFHNVCDTQWTALYMCVWAHTHTHTWRWNSYVLPGEEKKHTHGKENMWECLCQSPTVCVPQNFEPPQVMRLRVLSLISTTDR